MADGEPRKQGPDGLLTPDQEEERVKALVASLLQVLDQFDPRTATIPVSALDPNEQRRLAIHYEQLFNAEWIFQDDLQSPFWSDREILLDHPDIKQRLLEITRNSYPQPEQGQYPNDILTATNLIFMEVLIAFPTLWGQFIANQYHGIPSDPPPRFRRWYYQFSVKEKGSREGNPDTNWSHLIRKLWSMALLIAILKEHNLQLNMRDHSEAIELLGEGCAHLRATKDDISWHRFLSGHSKLDIEPIAHEVATKLTPHEREKIERMADVLILASRNIDDLVYDFRYPQRSVLSPDLAKQGTDNKDVLRPPNRHMKVLSSIFHGLQRKRDRQ